MKIFRKILIVSLFVGSANVVLDLQAMKRKVIEQHLAMLEDVKKQKLDEEADSVDVCVSGLISFLNGQAGGLILRACSREFNFRCLDNCASNGWSVLRIFRPYSTMLLEVCLTSYVSFFFEVFGFQLYLKQAFNDYISHKTSKWSELIEEKQDVCFNDFIDEMRLVLIVEKSDESLELKCHDLFNCACRLEIHQELFDFFKLLHSLFENVKLQEFLEQRFNNSLSTELREKLSQAKQAELQMKQIDPNDKGDDWIILES